MTNPADIVPRGFPAAVFFDLRADGFFLRVLDLFCGALIEHIMRLAADRPSSKGREGASNDCGIHDYHPFFF
jgi:hypothetical protein